MNRPTTYAARLGRIARWLIGAGVVAVAGCDATKPTGVEDEILDFPTPAFVLVESDGGNSMFTYAWRVDSASGLASYMARPKCPASSACPALYREQVVDTATLRLLFARTQTPEFRALHAHYPGALIADLPTMRITLVVNGRRRVVEGNPPEPAVAFMAVVQALAPAPAGG